MESTLLWALLAQLSPGELSEAERWLASPVHNQRADLTQLLALLCAALRSGKAAPSREEAWAELFPEQAYNDQQLRLRCSYLLRQLEDWLAWRQWQEEQLYDTAYTLAAYRKLGLKVHFRKRLATARAAMEQSKWRSPDYYQALYRLELEHHLLASANAQRHTPQDFQTQDDVLTAAMLSLKLRHACNALAYIQVAGGKHQVAIMETVQAWALKPPYADLPAVLMYREAYHALTHPDDDAAFATFRQAILTHVHRFPSEEMRDLLLLAINACIRRINAGQTPALREALTLYQLGLDRALLLENGQLTPYTYNNVVGIALRLGELDWAKSFVYQYRAHLAAEQRDTHFALNAGRLAYATRDYQEALAHLQQADYRDFFHQMAARILQLKIFYDTDEYDLLEAHLRNTRALLRRRRLSSYHVQNYRNILKLTERLMRLNVHDRADVQQLHERIQATEPLTERAWLLERC